MLLCSQINQVVLKTFCILRLFNSIIYSMDPREYTDQNHNGEIRYSILGYQINRGTLTQQHLFSGLIMLGSDHTIVVIFHDGLARLGKQNALNSYCVLVGRRNSTSLTLTKHPSCPCASSGRRVKKVSVMDIRGMSRNPDMLRVPLGCGEASQVSQCFSLIMSHHKASSAFPATRRSCQNRPEFMQPAYAEIKTSGLN